MADSLQSLAMAPGCTLFGMVEVSRIDPNSKRGRPVNDDNSRQSSRTVNLLVAGLVAMAIVVLTFAVVRSRTATSDVPGEIAVTERTAHEGFRVLRVSDGDTLVIIGDDQIELTLRLAGIDAPEGDQPFGPEATEFLRNLLADQPIQLDNIRRGKFGRIVADAYIDSKWINLELVRHGFAWVYPGTTSRILEQAENRARRDRLGLWASDSPVPPWEWRKDGN